MGFFKKLLNDATENMKEALEQKKNELQESINKKREEVEQSIASRLGGMSTNTNTTRKVPEKKEAVINTEYGIIKDGILEIKEGITELKEGSLSKYRSLKKVIFPASLTKLETHVFEENAQLEELDFSKVTKLEYLPYAFVFGDSKISVLRIPYGVKHVGCGVVSDVDRTHPLEIFVPATVSKFECFATNNAVTFYLFTPDVDIEYLIDDAKIFYVLEKDYFKYKHQMEQYDGEVPVEAINDGDAALYSDLINGPDGGSKMGEDVNRKTDNPSNNSTTENIQTTDEGSIKFSPRVEALIKSAFRDGILSKKEKEIIIKRAVAEGEDADEFEMLLDSRIAEEGIKEE